MSDHSINEMPPPGSNRSRPLRVALVASSLRLGGAEKQTAYIARALLRAGSDARFFYVGDGGYYERIVRETGIPFRLLAFFSPSQQEVKERQVMVLPFPPQRTPPQPQGGQ